MSTIASAVDDLAAMSFEDVVDSSAHLPDRKRATILSISIVLHELKGVSALVFEPDGNGTYCGDAYETMEDGIRALCRLGILTTRTSAAGDLIVERKSLGATSAN